jgi:glutathione S-transferase
MITLHAFANMFPGGIGETKDMRVQWALEEMGLPYTVRAWDYLAGETNTPEFTALSPFNQIPALEHDGLVIAESAAILIHLAETSGRLTPAEAAGREHVRQWCIAAMATVAPVVSMTSMVDAGFMGQDPAAREFLVGLARRWLAGLERRLKDHDWIAADDFTVADIVLAGVLREARDNELMDDFPAVRAFHDRAHARPAWRRTRALTAERMGVDLAAIP